MTHKVLYYHEIPTLASCLEKKPETPNELKTKENAKNAYVNAETREFINRRFEAAERVILAEPPLQLAQYSTIALSFNLGNEHMWYIFARFEIFVKNCKNAKVTLELDNNQFSFSIFECDYFISLLQHENLVRVTMRENLFHRDDVLSMGLLEETQRKLIFISQKDMLPSLCWMPLCARACLNTHCFYYCE